MKAQFKTNLDNSSFESHIKINLDHLLIIKVNKANTNLMIAVAWLWCVLHRLVREKMEFDMSNKFIECETILTKIVDNPHKELLVQAQVSIYHPFSISLSLSLPFSLSSLLFLRKFSRKMALWWQVRDFLFWYYLIWDFSSKWFFRAWWTEKWFTITRRSCQSCGSNSRA